MLAYKCIFREVSSSQMSFCFLFFTEFLVYDACLRYEASFNGFIRFADVVFTPRRALDNMHESAYKDGIRLAKSTEYTAVYGGAHSANINTTE